MSVVSKKEILITKNLQNDKAQLWGNARFVPLVVAMRFSRLTHLKEIVEILVQKTKVVSWKKLVARWWRGGARTASLCSRYLLAERQQHRLRMLFALQLDEGCSSL
jgi:hypothetical protein